MTTKAQTAERLLQVVRMLDELPREKHLDMSQWYRCGTVACALGWSGVDPWFTRRGFHLEALYGDKVYKRPKYKVFYDLEAAAAFFGIDYWDAHDLFMPGSWASRSTRATVAKKIRAFVKALPA